MSGSVRKRVIADNDSKLLVSCLSFCCYFLIYGCPKGILLFIEEKPEIMCLGIR
jgi:hypothetical protein